MYAPVLHKIHRQTFWLSPLRALYWEEQRALVLSDLHFGKTGHFRKAGIPVPQAVYRHDLQRLSQLLEQFQPAQLIAVGDLFHSRANLELEQFRHWREGYPALEFHLVKGNHDILEEDWYPGAGIRVWEQERVIDDIGFAHEQGCGTRPFTFCGHLHPGVVISGPGKQSLRLPCFYFTPSHCVLPAFSLFTGLATIRPAKADSVFAVVENSLIQLQ
jgi:uncharacterized protein